MTAKSDVESIRHKERVLHCSGIAAQRVTAGIFRAVSHFFLFLLSLFIQPHQCCYAANQIKQAKVFCSLMQSTEDYRQDAYIRLMWDAQSPIQHMRTEEFRALSVTDPYITLTLQGLWVREGLLILYSLAVICGKYTASTLSLHHVTSRRRHPRQSLSEKAMNLNHVFVSKSTGYPVQLS